LKSQSLVSKNFFAFLSLLVLAALVFAVPVHLKAQAATTATPTAQATPAPAPEAAKPTEEEQKKVFLEDGPLVRATAKALNISRETTADIFMYLNFSIIFFAVAITLARIAPRVLRQRSLDLKANLETARKATTDAQARLAAIETKLAGLDTEIAAIRAQVEAESQQDEVRIKATIDDEKTRIVASAEQEIGVAAAHARRELRHFAADLAIEQASKQLVLTPENDAALIADFIQGTTSISALPGGKN
jgi:F-type H+-transporting ATPase subunit b